MEPRLVVRIAIPIAEHWLKRGLLCQLEATVPLRDMEIRWSPGFRATVAEQTGTDAAVLLTEATDRLQVRLSAAQVDSAA